MFVFANCWTVTLSHFQESDSKNDICLWFGIWNFALALLVTANICELLCALKNQPPPQVVPTALGWARPPAGPQGKFPNREAAGSGPRASQGTPEDLRDYSQVPRMCVAVSWFSLSLICPRKENKMLWMPQTKPTQCVRVSVLAF